MVKWLDDFQIHELFRQVLDVNSDLYCFKSDKGTWQYTNDYILKLLELDKTEVIGKNDLELAILYPHLRIFFENSNHTDEQTWKSHKVKRYVERITTKKGVSQFIEVIKIPFYYKDGSRKGLLIIGNDITIEKFNEIELASRIRELKDFKFALDQSSILSITDKKGTITYVNDAFCKASQYKKEELLGNNHRILNSGYHTNIFFRKLRRTIQNGLVWTGDIKNRKKDGTEYWLRTTIVPFFNEDGEPYQYMYIRQDITEQKDNEARILQMIYLDEMTGLRNRRCFQDETSQWLTENEEKNELALIFLDLYRFSYVNDTLGHNEGDVLLQAVAERLSLHLKGKGDVYRFGGDEFIIVLKGTPKEEVEARAQELVSLFDEPFYTQHEKVYLTIKIGISLYPHDGDELESLVKRADHAVYIAKDLDTKTIQFFTNEIYEHMTRTMKLEKALREAVEKKELTLVYQPQVTISSTEIVGVEALLRWEHPALGSVPPSAFIPLAEQTGLIVPLTKWVIEAVCKQHWVWREMGLPPVRVAVNLSPACVNNDTIQYLVKILEESRIEAHYLELEITESVMKDPIFSTKIVQQLKNLGVRVSIDDFGTGYSSLAYLRQFPIDSLKIDRTFINEIQRDNGVIVKTILDMASHLKLGVVAEGVENKEQAEFLKSLNCDEGQGYFYAKPLPVDEVTKLLLKQTELVPKFM